MFLQYLKYMFEEYQLTYAINSRLNYLPALIRLGSFSGKNFEIPVLLPFRDGLCINIETPKDSMEALLQLQYIALDLFKRINTSLLHLSFVDLGLNSSFRLIDTLHNEHFKIISSQESLREELKRLTETARYISSKCLGYDYETLNDYNKDAEYKEPYNILFIANFPKGFRKEDIEIIDTLISEGRQSGIYVVLHTNQSLYPESDNSGNEIIKLIRSIQTKTFRLIKENDRTEACGIDNKIFLGYFKKYIFEFEKYPQDKIKPFLNHLNSGTIETGQISNSDFLNLKIGRSGRDNVYLQMGQKSGVYHGFIAGQSGTGKSTLLNNIITSIAELYSPDEMRLFLLDYKYGVEFQIYEQHPNVELLLLDNKNLSAGVDALRFLKNELVRRSDLFKQLDITINNIDEYNKKVSKKIPRILMIVDEVQQLFVNYEVRREVNHFIKEIAKLGRAFGIHLLFSSQSYMDCHIDNDILSQMSLRIAYGLANGAECRAILGPDNYAPMKIPMYSAIYNAKNGDKEANIMVKMDNFEKDKISSILKRAEEKYKDAIGFEKKIIKTENVEKNNDILSPIDDSSKISIPIVKREEYKDVDYKNVFGF